VVGIGFGFMYLPSIVMVSFYFDKRRALATGLAVCGSGVGTFVLAPFFNFLVSEYGWKVSQAQVIAMCWLIIRRPIRAEHGLGWVGSEQAALVHFAKVCFGLHHRCKNVLLRFIILVTFLRLLTFFFSFFNVF